jgi:hypothetical protein
MKIVTKRVKSRFRRCLYPYKEYHSRGKLYIDDTGRARINLLKEKELFGFISYAKYLWEVSHHRKVKKGYEVDHIDGDCTNDIIENLQEISSKDNRKKGTSKVILSNNKNAKRLFLWCPVCGKRFKIFKWKVNLKKLKKGKEFHFCCKKCAWKAQNKSFVLPKFQKFKRIKLKEFIPANKHEKFKKFSKPIYVEKKVRVCDCGNDLPTIYSKYCCKECREKFSPAFKIDKEKLLKYCKRSLKKFGRYNCSWIGRKLGVTDGAIRKNIIKYKI